MKMKLKMRTNEQTNKQNNCHCFLGEKERNNMLQNTMCEFDDHYGGQTACHVHKNVNAASSTLPHYIINRQYCRFHCNSNEMHSYACTVHLHTSVRIMRICMTKMISASK